MNRCRADEPMPLQELFDRLAAGERKPLSCTMELTARCNLACRHCYMLPYRDEPELSTDEVLRIFDDLAAAGCLTLLLTGGEPLLRQDFPLLYRAARERGLVVTVFTNGTRVDDAVVEALAERPPLLVEVSLYGATEATTRAVTGRGGMNEAAWAGLARLREAGLAVRAKTILLPQNVDELGAIRERAAALGVEHRFNAEIFGRVDGHPGPIAAALPDEEAVAVESGDPFHRRLWRAALRGGRRHPRGSAFPCRAAERGFHIGPYGDMNVCTLLRKPGWSLRRGSFREGWERALPEALAVPAREAWACYDCELFGLCLPCPARCFLETGELTATPRALCRRSHAIAACLARRPAAEDEEESAREGDEPIREEMSA